MVPVGRIDTIEGAAMPLADILGNFEIIVGIIAREPFVWQVVGIGKGCIAIDAYDDEYQDYFEPWKTL